MPDFSSHYQPLTITGNVLPVGTGPLAPRVKKQRSTLLRESTVKGSHSPRFSGGLKSASAAATYRMPWSSLTKDQGVGSPLVQAQLDFIGYTDPVYDTNNNVIGLNRIIPYPHPSDPNHLYCDAVSNIEGDVPLGQDADMVATYSEAVISATFATRDYVIGDNGTVNEALLSQYVTITIEPTGRYERIPNAQSFRFLAHPPPAAGSNIYTVDSNGQLVALTAAQIAQLVGPFVTNSLVMTFAEAEVAVVWHQIPVVAIPWAAISTCIGTVDASPVGPFPVGSTPFSFMSSTYLGPILQPASGRDRSKFFCLPPKISDPYPMSNGAFAVDIQYRFKYYPFGAQYAYNWKAREFQMVVSTTNNFKAFYNSSNFNTLFLGT